MLRRPLIALATLAAATALGASAAAARPVLFVGNLGDGTVSLVDPHSLDALGRLNVIPDGDTPRDPAQAAAYPALVKSKGTNYVQGIAVSPDGRTLYVSRGFLGDVAAFDIASRRLLWRLEVSGVRADHIALSPDGARLFVSALTTNEVQVIDTRTHAFVGSFPTGDWPHVLEFSPDGRYIYNGSLGNQLLPDGANGKKQLTVADPGTLQVVRTYQFDAGVRPFVFASDGRTLFLQLSYFNGFAELDLATGQVVRRVALPVTGPGAQMQRKDYPNQAAHHGIALSPDGRYVCDAGTISNYVALVSRPALSLAAIVPVGDQPAEAETSLDGRYCFVANRGPGAHANSVSVISYAARREVARVPVGQRPQEETEAVVPDAVLRAAGLAGGVAPRLTRVGMSRRRFALGGRSGRRTAFRWLHASSRAATVTIGAGAALAGRPRAQREHAHLSRPGPARTASRAVFAAGGCDPAATARLRAVSADGLRSRTVSKRFRVMRACAMASASFRQLPASPWRRSSGLNLRTVARLISG